jgi:hypothetical protein
MGGSNPNGDDDPLTAAFKNLDRAWSAFKTGDALGRQEYLEAVYEITNLFVSFIEGPIAWSVDAADLLRQLAESWALSRGIENIIQQEFDLGSALSYAQFKDPAHMKRLLDALHASLPSQRAALQEAIYGGRRPHWKRPSEGCL